MLPRPTVTVVSASPSRCHDLQPLALKSAVAALALLEGQRRCFRSVKPSRAARPPWVAPRLRGLAWGLRSTRHARSRPWHDQLAPRGRLRPDVDVVVVPKRLHEEKARIGLVLDGEGVRLGVIPVVRAFGRRLGAGRHRRGRIETGSRRTRADVLPEAAAYSDLLRSFASTRRKGRPFAAPRTLIHS
eukprot:scaffold2141_cov282-Pinguiococcus_pyrenoidosus.AAC.10